MFQKFKSFTGPKNYKFKDPDTGYLYNAPTKAALLQHILAYRGQNGLEPIEAIHTVLENYWCGLPENRGNCEPNPALKRGLFAYIKGGIVLAQNVLYKKFAPQEKAEERTKACLNCPHNSFPPENGFDKWADMLAEASTKGKKVKEHSSLGICDICTCNLRAKVFFGGVLEESKENMSKFPEFCWVKREIDGYKR